MYSCVCVCVCVCDDSGCVAITAEGREEGKMVTTLSIFYYFPEMICSAWVTEMYNYSQYKKFSV